MIVKLSSRYRKEIAFSLLYIFFLPGFYSFVSASTGKMDNTITANSKVRDDYKNNYAVRKESPALPANSIPAGLIPVKGKSLTRVSGPAKTNIGGPGQPEMSAFKPVGSDNMVDPFTGDFSYNIPLLDVGGYPVNIFYNSGITMDQEASWVGLGWNINPGTINRNMRGLPDDFDGTDKITKTQYTKPDKTYGVTVGPGFEFFGGITKLDLSGGIFYNNMHGIGLEAGINPSLALGSKMGDEKTRPLSIGWKLNANSQSGGSTSFNVGLNFAAQKDLKGSVGASIGYHSRQGLQALHMDAEVSKMLGQSTTQASIRSGNAEVNPTIGTSINFAYPSFIPSIRSRTSSENYNLDLGFGVAGAGAFTHLRLGGYYTRSWIRDQDITVTQPAYGMLFMEQGKNDKNALLDFNRVNDGIYTPNTPAIAVPIYTYDVFSITGEGTGGSFKATRGDLGYVRDPYWETNSTAAHLGIELGAGGYGHGGVNGNMVLTPSYSSGWDKGNLAKNAMDFKQSYGAYQAVYFKNPGEKSIPDTVYQNAIGGENMVRLKMTNVGFGSPTLTPSLVKYSDGRNRLSGDLPIDMAKTAKQRDKRTQVISILSADEADRVGLDRKIPFVHAPYDSNTVIFGCQSTAQVDSIKRNSEFRKGHHISEIDVVMQDGRRYIYGTPVYNTKQVDVTFNRTGSANGSGTNNQLTSYTPNQDNVQKQNNYGKDGYVESQTTPPYAHSYLITALLSPNYVDVKGDGVTEDDMGDAIKFNYTKMEKPVKWRTPFGDKTAILNEGLKTDKDDDKAHYVYGEREMVYLYSIESKNMVARFYVKNDRKDCRSVLDETGAIDNTWGAQRLDKIQLFSKGDLLKNGTNAKPVKTVHFNYDYSLCPNATGSVAGYGKLTLKEIYFTYNGNEKYKKNYYHFKYPATADKNPAYDFTAMDRWGNYKPAASNNPGGLVNADYPYTLQDKQKSDTYAQAWTMNQVVLPSGSSINIDYEADDYAYVQDMRATNMITITGFGNKANPSSTEMSSNKLYESKSSDNDYVYITVPKAITATGTAAIKAQIANWYLGDMLKTNQVLLRLSVDVPGDARGSGFEMINVYANILDYGLVPNTAGQNADAKKIYIKVKKLESGYTPMVQYSLQFLKNNLPSKIYPGYDVSESGALVGVIKALGGLFHSFKEVFDGGMSLMKQENSAKYVELDKSFIRLSDPYLQKYGGGLRVKKVVINDNFNKMTASTPTATDGMQHATYGQEYFYTKKELINGELTTISSGVASWEPAIGGEENPHRQAVQYFNKNPKADYEYNTVELPITEMLYPSAMVGYSRVEVRSIHRDTVKNAAGIQVSEFYTTREFPTLSNYTPLTENDATDKYESNALDKLLKINLKTAVALSQGFKVELNDMNGRMRKQSTYAPNNLNDPISSTENFYNIQKASDNTYKFKHYFPVIAGPTGSVTQSAVIGRDIELMTDFREHNIETITTNVNFNLDVISGFLIPIPIPTTWRPVCKESNTYRSSAVLKIVNHYGMLDSVVAIDKGSMVSTKNLVYDAESGDPLVTRTNNEHNKPVYNFGYPAHWAYSGMGFAYKNIDVTYSNLTFKYGKLETPAGVDMSLFESGDEIMVTSQTDPGPLATAPCDATTGNLPKSTAKKVWAINTARVNSLTPQWLFIDADGIGYTAQNVQIRIIRSGKRNMYSNSIGSITSLNSPINAATGQLQFNDATNIIQTAAATYKDKWRVDNSLYMRDTLIKTQTLVPRTYLVINADDNITIQQDGTQFSLAPRGYSMAASSFLKPSGGYFTQKFWVKFNGLSQFLTGNFSPQNIDQAYVWFPSHAGGSDHPFPPIHYCGGEDGSRSELPYQGNTMVYQRMTTPWYNYADVTSWKNAFLATDNLSGQTLDFSGSNGTGSPGGFSGCGNASNISSISNVLRQMITDRNNGILNSAPGIVAQIFTPAPPVRNATDAANYWCFNSATPSYGSIPRIEIYYFNCTGKIDSVRNNIGYCNSVTSVSNACFSKFTKKSINPYVEGIWGNWRVDTSFAYYGSRKDSLISNAIDTRTSGTIANFKPFWNFASAAVQRNGPAADVWVWNSTITQYNRKGYETENKDPLGRYNAGLYGYNQQLPVAVVNNAMYREAMFDGFEDYAYQSSPCGAACKPQRQANLGDIAGNIDSTQRHTGKYSLRVNAGQSINFTVPVVNASVIDNGYGMRVKVDSTTSTAVYLSSNANGTGVQAQYYSYPSIVALPPFEPGGTYSNLTSTLTNQNPSVTGIASANQKTSVRWQGILQVPKTGTYQFVLSADNCFRLKIDGIQVTNNTNWTNSCCLNSQTTTAVNWTMGDRHTIELSYYNYTGPGSLDLKWIVNGAAAASIPITALYMPGTTVFNTVVNTTTTCTRLDSLQVTGNALNDTLSLIQGKRMLLSAWVKEGGQDCKCAAYVNNSITIKFNNGAIALTAFKPAGTIIEGWQRYEAVFDIPANANNMQVSLAGNAQNSVYFDDLRLHPYNANMKSFVYHPQNLRLTAELDENNYASFYEYDDDGTLTRVKKETTGGIKTITETRSHLQTIVQ